MPDDKTKSFIAKLLDNSALYKKTAHEANEYWGKKFADSDQMKSREEDKNARKALRAARNKLFLMGAIRRSGP